MAQTGYTPIQLYRSATPGAVPSAGNLSDGELAINYADGKLFYKTSGAAVAELSGGLTYVVKTTTYTVADKQGVLADTSGGAFTVTLPATPATGAQCVIADHSGTFGTNNLTVGRNGSTIAGLAEDLVLDISGVSVQFVYNGTTWDVYAQVGGNGGTAVTLNGTQTLTNKDLTSGTNTFPSSLATLTGTQTLTNKTLTSPVETTPTVTGPGYTVVDKGNSGTSTQTYDYSAGSYQTSTATGNHTIAFSNWPATGKEGVLQVVLTNGGAYTITWPTINWIKPDGTTTTSISTYLSSLTGRTALQTSGVDQFLFWTRDAGTTVYGKII